MKFSERIGKKTVKVDFQVNSMDDELRNSLWNACMIDLFRNFNPAIKARYNPFFISLWMNFFKEPIDTIDNYFANTLTEIRVRFFKWDWDQVYDFIEFIANVESPMDINGFTKGCNLILERELSGYRFVATKIVQITSNNEIEEIEKTLTASNELGLKTVHLHLSKALSKLSDKKTPDYPNSMKESISAVESISGLIIGAPKSTLADALKKIEKDIDIHPALKEVFLRIYGYTSDSGGIRHALSDKNTPSLEDARYMLISCSAFINYLIVKADKAGIKISDH